MKWEKLDNDNKTNRFIKKYGKLYATEVEAFLIYKPDIFEKLVQKEVDDLYDKKIYGEEEKKYAGDNLDKIIDQIHDRASLAFPYLQTMT